MKKGLLGIIILSIFLIGGWVNNTVVHAKDSSVSLKEEDFIRDVKFDPETRIFSGTTAPYSNIYLSQTAINISADQNGHFEFGVPDTLETANVTVLDLIGNQSTEFSYDFNKGTVAMDSKDSSSVASQQGEVNNGNATASANQEENAIAENNETNMATGSVTSSSKNSSKSSSSSKKQENDEKENSSSSLWLPALLILLIAIGIGIYFYQRNKKQRMMEKHAKKPKH